MCRGDFDCRGFVRLCNVPNDEERSKKKCTHHTSAISSNEGLLQFFDHSLLPLPTFNCAHTVLLKALAAIRLLRIFEFSSLAFIPFV